MHKEPEQARGYWLKCLDEMNDKEQTPYWYAECHARLGHKPEALAGLKVKFVRNPDFAGGLASSVKSGISAVPEEADGAVVCLGDMPLISAQLIDRLIEAFAPDRGHLIAVPVSEGRRGNPVLWSRRFFKELMTLDGDTGARHLITKHTEAVTEVPVEGDSAFLDIDTPQGLEAARRG